ncbi:hypothetical protein C2845_PM07G38060 [Panicum miliaceum]|uniref:DUF1618 domain-containing protein n=1 Tax=Panicum miliaceum TaxID=4540 RepID=A0A3L6SMV8_PANMI|nr:hypothetical protein C2845_PM07G38060 [Panicum miliaceum]
MPQIRGLSDPDAIAAHRNSILFRMTVPFEDPMYWHDIFSFPVDYMVYSCSSSSTSSPPSLTMLPLCFHGGITDPELDDFFRPYRRQQQRIMFNEEMGILCHGDNGEFNVAHFAHCHRQIQLCLLHHPPPTGIPTGWNLSTLQLPPDTKIDLYSWRTDVVVIPTDRCLCWVDYYQGMLLVDVLADTPDQQRLHSIRLPAQALKSRRIYNDAGDPDPFRCVSVTDDGSIKLVSIFDKDPPSPPDFTIITWTLVDIKKGSWRKDVDTIMGADEFFGLYSAT